MVALCNYWLIDDFVNSDQALHGPFIYKCSLGRGKFVKNERDVCNVLREIERHGNVKSKNKKAHSPL
jgi:hypothetical protein